MRPLGIVLMCLQSAHDQPTGYANYCGAKRVAHMHAHASEIFNPLTAGGLYCKPQLFARIASSKRSSHQTSYEMMMFIQVYDICESSLQGISALRRHCKCSSFVGDDRIGGYIAYSLSLVM